MSRRTDRVGDLVRAELSDLLRREVSDPRLRLASVTSVQLSADLKYARVRISILGSDSDRTEAFAALERAKGYLRRHLGQRLRLRATPELIFELDRGAEYSQRISDLLETLDVDHDEGP